MKEIYKVKPPKRVILGDPKYFEQFGGARLRKRIVDCKVPKPFAARVVLQYGDESPGTLLLYLAPKNGLEAYMSGSPHEDRESRIRQIGLESERYYVQIDKNEDSIRAESGCWACFEEVFRRENGKRVLNAAILAIPLPTSETVQQMRQRVQYFFQNAELMENAEDAAAGEAVV